MSSTSVCIVPVRWREEKLEFCLLASPGDSRWTFPMIDVEDGTDVAAAMNEMLGIEGQLECAAPYAEALNMEIGQNVWLLWVNETHSDWAKQNLLRRRWCRAEEARHRIRRKPLRRVLDATVREFATQ